MSQEVWWDKKTKATVEYKGRKNKLAEENREFVAICKKDQKQLKTYLNVFLYGVGYDCVVVGDGFLYAKGNIPFCLTAHMDTVHKEKVNTTYELFKDGDYFISSPQGIGGDDRCGIYMITQILRKGFKPYVVFCEDEEIGRVGSKKFCQTNLINQLKECKYIIELDRANSNDAVYYQCDNPEFTEFITNTTGYKKAYGSFSDISELCPKSGVAGVNLSCGYYNAHTLGEYVNMSEMKRTQEVVEKLLNTECVAYEYIERKYSYYNDYYYGTGIGYNKNRTTSRWYDDDYDDEWYDRQTYQKAKEIKSVQQIDYKNIPKSKTKDTFKDTDTICTLEVWTSDNETHIAQGTTFEEAWTQFFFYNPTYCFNDVLDYNETYI